MTGITATEPGRKSLPPGPGRGEDPVRVKRHHKRRPSVPPPDRRDNDACFQRRGSIRAGDPGLTRPAHAGGDGAAGGRRHRPRRGSVRRLDRIPRSGGTPRRRPGPIRGQRGPGAVSAVNTEISDLLRGRSWASLAEADQAMIDLDGTPNKSRLGANATVGASMALARALAASAGTQLWQWLTPEGSRRRCRSRISTCSTAACTRPTSWTSRNSWSPRSARPRWPKPSARAPRSTVRCAASCPAGSSRRAWATRAASLPRWPSPKKSCGSWSRPFPTPATRRAQRACPSRWTWPHQSSASQMAATRWPATCWPAGT